MADKRFEEVYRQGKLTVTKVLRDNQTGVLYMCQQEGYGLGLTVLVDAEGKPLLDENFIPSS